MGYLELSIDISKLDPLNREVLIHILNSYEFEGVLEEGKEIKAYIKEDLTGKDDFLRELESLGSLQNLNLKWRSLEEKNWNEEWEKSFHPVTIGSQCHIRASFHPEKIDVPFEIVIDPKMSFGTGHHETTALMIEFILNIDMKGKIILDMGCGTGVLAILASKMKAKHIDAIDNDIWAFENTKDNVKINGIHNVEVKHGDSRLLKNQQYDIIFANINRNILLNDIPHFAEAISNSGLLLLSGFYLEDVPALEEKARDYNLEIEKSKSENNWVAAIFIKTKSRR